MTEPLGQAAGFWSYTHQDNEQDDGRIVRLAERISSEYSLLTGEELQLFVDREGIAWGDAWRSKIDGALDITAFFIPLITPRYFTREECRRELLRFASQAKSLGVEDLLLPIYYVNVVDLKEDSDDEAMALVAATQREDWRDLRLLDETSAEYRQAVNRLARRLAEIAAAVAARPTSVPIVTAASDDEDDDRDDEPGFMDVLAEGEEALPRWGETIQEFPEVLDELYDVTTAARSALHRSDQSGKGFAGRLVIARQLAADLSPIADRLQELGARYSSELREVDPMFLTLIRLTREGVETDSFSEIERQGAAEFVENIRGLIEASDSTVEALRQLVTAIGQNLAISRDLRPVLKRLQVGLRNVVDGQALIEGWQRRIDEAPPLT